MNASNGSKCAHIDGKRGVKSLFAIIRRQLRNLLPNSQSEVDSG